MLTATERAEWMALQVFIAATQHNGRVVTHDLVDAVMSRDADKECGKANVATVRRIIRAKAGSERVRVIFTPDERYWAIREQLHHMSADEVHALRDDIADGGDDDPRAWDKELIDAISVRLSNRLSPRRLHNAEPVSIRLWREPRRPVDAAPAPVAEELPALDDLTCPTEARFSAYSAYETADHAARSLSPGDMDDLSYALTRLIAAHPDQALDATLVDAVNAVCDAWTALEDATDRASRATAHRAAEEAVTRARTAILAVHPHADRMRGTDMPATADDIRAAARGYNAVSASPEELSALETGTPTIRVHCRSDSGSGWTVTALITAGVDTHLGRCPAHPPVVVHFRKRDGRQDAATSARKVLGARFRVDVPVEYANDRRV